MGIHRIDRIRYYFIWGIVTPSKDWDLRSVLHTIVNWETLQPLQGLYYCATSWKNKVLFLLFWPVKEKKSSRSVWHAARCPHADRLGWFMQRRQDNHIYFISTQHPTPHIKSAPSPYTACSPPSYFLLWNLFIPTLACLHVGQHNRGRLHLCVRGNQLDWQQPERQVAARHILIDFFFSFEKRLLCADGGTEGRNRGRDSWRERWWWWWWWRRRVECRNTSDWRGELGGGRAGGV